MLIDFRGRAREGEKKGEKHWCERETSISCLSYVPRNGNRACNFLGYGMTLQPIEPPQPGRTYVHFILIFRQLLSRSDVKLWLSTVNEAEGRGKELTKIYLMLGIYLYFSGVSSDNTAPAKLAPEAITAQCPHLMHMCTHTCTQVLFSALGVFYKRALQSRSLMCGRYKPASIRRKSSKTERISTRVSSWSLGP